MSVKLEKLKQTYESLDLNNVCDNKTFWATVKPLFSNKIKSAENIVLSENGKLIKGEEEVVNIFNDFFVNIVPNLDIRTQHEFFNKTHNSKDPIANAISKYENHPSIILIKRHTTVTEEKIEKLVTNLYIRKAVQSNDIPTKLVKERGYLFSKYIARSINRCIAEGTFINAFRKAKVRAIYKKNKSNYRPISVLSNVSKIYERCIYEKIYSYFEKTFLKHQCSFL